eukprot:5458632-Pyramimonas_sp.AAC.1
MQNKTNAIAWNPMEAFNFTAANEDCNLYSYDMRKLDIATCIHQDFVSVRGVPFQGSLALFWTPTQRRH